MAHFLKKFRKREGIFAGSHSPKQCDHMARLFTIWPFTTIKNWPNKKIFSKVVKSFGKYSFYPKKLPKSKNYAQLELSVLAVLFHQLPLTEHFHTPPIILKPNLHLISGQHYLA